MIVVGSSLVFFEKQTEQVKRTVEPTAVVPYIKISLALRLSDSRVSIKDCLLVGKEDTGIWVNLKAVLCRHNDSLSEGSARKKLPLPSYTQKLKLKDLKMKLTKDQ